jgi:hypothetical protein
MAARLQHWICSLPFLRVYVQIHMTLFSSSALREPNHICQLRFRLLHFPALRLEGSIRSGAMEITRIAVKALLYRGPKSHADVPLGKLLSSDVCAHDVKVRGDVLYQLHEETATS